MEKVKWTKGEEDFIIEKYKTMTAVEIAEILGKTKHQVGNKISSLVLDGRMKRKNKQYRERQKSNRRLEETKAGLDISKTKFKVGQVLTIQRPIDKRIENNIFVGVVIQDSKNHVTLKHKKLGYLESFSKVNIGIGYYKIKEWLNDH